MVKEAEAEVGICKGLPSADEDVVFLANDRVLSDECFKPTNLKNGLLYADEDSGIIANSSRSVSSSGKMAIDAAAVVAKVTAATSRAMTMMYELHRAMKVDWLVAIILE